MIDKGYSMPDSNSRWQKSTRAGGRGVYGGEIGKRKGGYEIMNHGYE